MTTRGTFLAPFSYVQHYQSYKVQEFTFVGRGRSHGGWSNVWISLRMSYHIANVITSRLVASAVILPDTVGQLSPPLSAKRRQSSVSEVDSKRPRLLEDVSMDQADGGSSPPAKPKRASEQDESRKLEERKRGKRLFGALLGTLAQSSSSTAQKRRVDIEKKQQAKLKQQAEEHDEQKKQRLDALMEIRQQEQKKYDKQSVGFDNHSR